MMISIRIVALWFLTQLSTVCWSAVPSDTAVDTGVNPPAGDPPLLNMSSYEQLLKLQETLTAGEGLDAIFQALYGQVIANSDPIAPKNTATTPTSDVSQDITTGPVSLNSGQENNGLPLPWKMMAIILIGRNSIRSILLIWQRWQVHMQRLTYPPKRSFGLWR